ncbi:MAG: ATP synthase F1 subunit delta [Tidjanibacter sp.]|nr:ATP synthase F1 subunit delta [Tidjanibacter sp.]
MNSSILIGRYAKALLAQADSIGQAEALYPTMEQLAHLLMGSHEVREVLNNPVVSPQRKCAIVLSCVEGCCAEECRALLGRFVDLVLAHHRERWLGEMSLGYVRLYRKSRGLVRVQLTTTTRPEEALLARLKAIVEERTGGVAEVILHTSPDIKGGFVLQVDDLLLDASLKGQLEKIRREFLRKNKTLV